jgi:hypothetical protein
MTNPSPRPALRKAEDATVHPAAPRPARASRAPRPAPAAADPVVVPGPRTIADTNRDANAAAAERARKAKGKPAAAPVAAPAKATRKKRKFSGSTSDHLRVPDTEFAEHPKPKGERKAPGKAAGKAKPAVSAKTKAAAAATKKPAGDELMSGKVVDLGAHVPKKLRNAARDEAKRRGLDLDAVTTEVLHEWLTRRD